MKIQKIKRPNTLYPIPYTRYFPHERGFSLIEMIVSIGLFAIIMLVSVGALLALVDANRKARALESVMNNLNITLDSMVRAMRMGSAYNCGGADIPDPVTGEDCGYSGAPLLDGNSTFSFTPFGKSATDASKRWVYTFVPGSGSTGGRLYKSEEGGSNAYPVTAPEVSIESMKFYVIGTIPHDYNQPKVVMVVKGTAGASAKIRTTFYIQATAVQRTLDI